MSLKRIKYFVVVAEELHFGKAAKRLNISQPPLSQQIQKLEDEIGVKLFYRTNRKVELTDAGKAFLNQSYKILYNIDKAYETTRQTYEGKYGELVIGFTGSALYNLIPILKIYREKYPFVKIKLHEMGATEQYTALTEERIHIGLICTPIERNGLIIKHLERLPFVLALPEDHYLAKGKDVLNLKSLVNESFIFIPREVSPHYYDLIMSIFHNNGITPKISLTAQVSIAVISFVASGDGIALVPSSIKNVPMKGIVFKEIEDNDVCIDIAVAYQDNQRSHVMSSFLSLIESIS